MWSIILWNVAGAPWMSSTKGEDGVLVQALWRREGRLLPGRRRQGDLPVPYGEVERGQVAGRSQPLDQFVHPGHGI